MSSSSSRRLVAPLALGACLMWGALPACNLVVGGEDKVLIELGSTNGGAGGEVGAGAGGSGPGAKGGESGTSSAGTSAGGTAGNEANAGAAGKASGAGTGGGGTGGSGAGTGGVGGSSAGTSGAAGSTPIYLKPGSVDCDAPPVQGVHRFCTDFTPLPSGWAGAGCSLASAEDGNVYWRWEQNAGSTCASFVNIVLGTPHTSASMAMWLRVDALGLGDGKIAVMHVRIGETTKGEIAVRVEKDVNGAATGTSLILQTGDASPETKVIGALGLGDWRHVRLRVGADGVLRGSFGATTGDTISSTELTTTSTPAAAPYIELPFRQLTPGTAPTRISIDELTVDVTQ